MRGKIALIGLVFVGCASEPPPKPTPPPAPVETAAPAASYTYAPPVGPVEES